MLRYGKYTNTTHFQILNGHNYDYKPYILINNLRYVKLMSSEIT